jgi:hypothetical protein
MLMGVTSWELGALRVPLIMVPDKLDAKIYGTQALQCQRNTLPRRHGM